MASCLGLYIQDNLIKYAKVTKDHEILKVENFGIKFYDNINEAISQIISETFSYKIPVSTNLSNETYDYFYLFSLLSKNDIKKSIDTEFESYCYDKGYNKNSLETRYALVPDLENNQKIKVIHISDNKLDINKKIQELDGNNVSTIVPLPMAIGNITDAKQKENIVVVNMEEKTTVTTIIDQKIYNVDIIENNVNDFLNIINQTENSYSKAYDICKNTTIYTMEGKELQSDDNEYLQDIMPVLYKIVDNLKTIIDNSPAKIQKIYITGIAAVINNIDLYFQEYFTECKCEILKPYFIMDNVGINIKDYIEVNSAIALGLQGLDYGVKNINFKSASLKDKTSKLFKVQIGAKKEENNSKKDKNTKSTKFDLSKFVDFKKLFKFDLKEPLDKKERWLVRLASALLAFIIIFSGFSIFTTNAINSKSSEISNVQSETTEQISLVDTDIRAIQNATTQYTELLDKVKKIKSISDENKKVKDSIPNFLTALMYAVPKGVSIKSITNTSGSTYRIVAEGKLYSQLAYLIGSIKTGGILYNVTSSSGVKSSDTITVIIEGSLFDEPIEKGEQ